MVRVRALLLLAALHPLAALAEGYGSADFMGTSHTVFRAAAQRASNDVNYVAVGRSWDNGSSPPQYKALIASYRTENGRQDLDFAAGSGLPGRRLLDFAGAGFDNLCGAVTYAYDGFIAACRSMNSLRYYDVYLVKFDNSGALDTTFGAFTVTGTTANGSNVVTSVSAIDGIVAGSAITGSGIPSGTRVLALSSTTLTLSKAATASAGGVTLTLAGVKTTGIGGSSAHALPRGIAYNAAGGTTANGGVVAVVGAVGTYSPGSFNPFLATFDQKSGAQVGATRTLGTISGTAVGIVFDEGNRGGSYFASAGYGGPGYYYMASTETSGSRSFYIHRFDSALLMSSAPWGTALDFSAAGGGNDSVPAGVTVFDNYVVAVGGNRAGAAPWNCAAAAVRLEDGTLSTTFGASTISGGTNNKGVTLFPNPTSASYDCILNTTAKPLFGGYLMLAGTAYNGTNYDNLAAEIDTKGALVSTFGTGGIKLQATGSGDDVINGMLHFSAVDKVYGIGRNQSATLTNAGASTEIATTMSLAGSWTPTTTTNAPGGRYSPSGVWTGSKMVIWGGCGVYPCSPPLNNGSQYDPVANTWTATATGNAPAGRRFHDTVWTGTKMVVWGGDNNVTGFNTGGRYDPATNTWASVTTTNAPGELTQGTAVWTGTRMIVWGGAGFGNIGGQYDPVGDAWYGVTTANAPLERWAHTAVWTGSRMIIWGGVSGLPGSFNDGALYDPTNDAWYPVTTTNAPVERYYAQAAWTGSKMIVWGGLDDISSANTGGMYDPASNTWVATTTTNAPGIRDSHSAVWTGSRFLVFGGETTGGASFYNDGGLFDPSTNSWTPMTTTNAPPVVEDMPVVWTGSKLIIWGGDPGFTNIGGVYSPISGGGSGGNFTARAAEGWTATTTTNAPAARWDHSVVWTGSKMIVWGGNPGVNTGGAYDPVANTWTATTTANAPAGRRGQLGQWTGSKMIVWGGFPATNTGGQYDPVLNTWSATATGNAPSARFYMTNVWTGSRMIVWGGGYTPINTGGIYDPATNTWTATTTANAPQQRELHTAVWTGSKMIVWGGWYTPVDESFEDYLNTGGIYDPASNSWTATPGGGNLPSVREYHTALWTGAGMLVWGGRPSAGRLNTGSIYYPSTGVWASVTTANAPSARSHHAAEWTGSRMIVWGGEGGSGWLNDGGVYDVSTAAWTAVPTANAPSVRFADHVSVWTGAQLLIWGGWTSSGVNTGGIYTAP